MTLKKRWVFQLLVECGQRLSSHHIQMYVQLFEVLLHQTVSILQRQLLKKLVSHNYSHSTMTDVVAETGGKPSLVAEHSSV